MDGLYILCVATIEFDGLQLLKNKYVSFYLMTYLLIAFRCMAVIFNGVHNAMEYLDGLNDITLEKY